MDCSTKHNMKVLKLDLFPSSDGGSGAIYCAGSDRHSCSESLDLSDIFLLWHTFC